MYRLQGIIIKDDKRYDYTESYLKGLGYYFYDENTAARDLDFIIFPFMGAVDEEFYNDGYFASLSTEVVVFSGVPNEYLKECCKKHNLAYYVMAGDKNVQIKNAVPTSEGVISHLITNRTETISGSRILVIG